MASTISNPIFTAEDVSSILESALRVTNVSKSDTKKMTTIVKKSIKEILKNQPKATVVRKSRTSEYTIALSHYKNNLKDVGYVGGPGKGAPTAEQRESAMLRLTTEELRALNFGISTKWCKSSPAIIAISNAPNISALR